ncbi:MAG: MBL fold metallo-hydrolase [Candidatus Paceibacterota bacterium]|jgi:L-ascorbate metabolism protein UlaG (beta-lactamase superfamily)
MIIQWFGQSCFKIETKNKIISLNPYSEDSLDFKPPRFKADILLLSHPHTDRSSKTVILGEPFVLEGPGEIEKEGIFIEGILSDHNNRLDQNREYNTIYKIETEDLTLCHLGNLGEKILKEEALEKLSEIDILFIPVGGDTIDAEEAVAIINQIEPKIVIPMHYQLKSSKNKLDALEKFLKAFGKKPEELDKLVIRKTQLPQETKLIVLKPNL